MTPAFTGCSLQGRGAALTRGAGGPPEACAERHAAPAVPADGDGPPVLQVPHPHLPLGVPAGGPRGGGGGVGTTPSPTSQPSQPHSRRLHGSLAHPDTSHRSLKSISSACTSPACPRSTVTGSGCMAGFGGHHKQVIPGQRIARVEPFRHRGELRQQVRPSVSALAAVEGGLEPKSSHYKGAPHNTTLEVGGAEVQPETMEEPEIGMPSLDDACLDAILGHLDAQSLARVQAVDTRFRRLAGSDAWGNVFQKDFPEFYAQLSRAAPRFTPWGGEYSSRLRHDRNWATAASLPPLIDRVHLGVSGRPRRRRLPACGAPPATGA